MVEINREIVIAELEGEATDGEIADYYAAKESGDYGEWGVTKITYKCKKCEYSIIEEVY